MRLKVVVPRQDAGADELFLQDVHEVQQLLGLAATYVIHGIGRHGQAVVARLALGGALHHADDAFHDVIDIGEVAAAVAVVIDLYGLATEQAVGKAKVGHVGPSGGAIDGEEAQAGGGYVVELAVAVGHELVALLGGGIEAHGIVHPIVNAERHLLVAAIHTGAAGVYQMLHGIVPARLQDVVEANHVGLDVRIRILDAVAHARLRGQVDHNVGLILPEHPAHQLAVGNAPAHELVTDALRHGLLYLPQPVLLQAGVIVAVDVVNAYYRAFCHLGEQPFYKVGPNESGRAGN